MDILVAVVTLLCLILLCKRLKAKWWSHRAIPGPKAYPIIGAALQVKPDQIHHVFYEFARKYGTVFSIQLFDADIIVLNTPDMVNKAFCTNGRVLNHRPHLFVGAHLDVMDSISFRNPDKEHRLSRKSFVKGLHVYGSGIPRFEQIVKGEIDRVIKQIEYFDGKQFEVVSLFQRSLVNIMSILLIGEEATDEDVRLFTEYTGVSDFFLNVVTNTTLSYFPFLLYLPYYKRKLDKLTRAKQKLQKKYFYDVKKSRMTEEVHGLVEWFLSDQDKGKDGDCFLSDNIIKAINLTDVLTAGTLTTSSVLPSIVLCLANHPGYQRRLQAELDEVIGRDREPNVSDKQNCQFIEAVIMETTRYITPVPFLLPHACCQDTELGGIEVKANTQVLANVWFIHHDEKIWGDPWAYRPERFLGDNGKLLPNDHAFMKSWLPFGTGRRGCPGMGLATTRLFLYLSSIFQRWTFVPAPGLCGSCDPKGDSFVCDLLLKPKPFHCIAKRRG